MTRRRRSQHRRLAPPDRRFVSLESPGGQTRIPPPATHPVRVALQGCHLAKAVGVPDVHFVAVVARRDQRSVPPHQPAQRHALHHRLRDLHAVQASPGGDAPQVHASGDAARGHQVGVNRGEGERRERLGRRDGADTGALGQGPDADLRESGGIRSAGGSEVEDSGRVARRPGITAFSSCRNSQCNSNSSSQCNVAAQRNGCWSPPAPPR